VLLLITSIIITLWSIIQVLHFVVTVSPTAYLHEPEIVGISYPCEYLHVSLRNAPTHRLADLMSLILPSSKSTSPTTLQNFLPLSSLRRYFDLHLWVARTFAHIPFHLTCLPLHKVLRYLMRTMKQVYAAHLRRVCFYVYTIGQVVSLNF
jgi:hypothetical protein